MRVSVLKILIGGDTDGSTRSRRSVSGAAAGGVPTGGWMSGRGGGSCWTVSGQAAAADSPHMRTSSAIASSSGVSAWTAATTSPSQISDRRATDASHAACLRIEHQVFVQNGPGQLIPVVPERVDAEPRARRDGVQIFRGARQSLADPMRPFARLHQSAGDVLMERLVCRPVPAVRDLHVPLRLRVRETVRDTTP